MVLVVVLVVIALLSLAGYTFAELMRAEQEAAVMHGRSVQAHALAESGLQAAQALLLQDRDAQADAGGVYDNPGRFRGVLVVDDDTPHGRGRFTLLAHAVEEGDTVGIRYGLEDESTRLNLNMLLVAEKQAAGGGRTLLMALPGMTEDVADAILDWLDPDDEVREFGAEVDEYSGMTPPYAPKNGPLETVEELLLVRGVTPQLLFGADANRNGLIDPHEEAAAAALGAATTGGSASNAADTGNSPNLGWARFLTLYSLESNTNAQGAKRININGDDLEQLYTELQSKFNSDTATFVVAYRQNGPSGSTGTTGGGNNTAVSASAGGQLDMTQPAKASFSTVLDLIGATVQVKFLGNQQATTIKSPFQPDALSMAVYLPKLMDELTVNPAPVIPGRININQAPRTVLLGIPGMTSETVEAIISQRDPATVLDHPERQHETWIMSEGIVTLEQMKALMPYVTAQGSVFRTQAVGFFEEGGPAARVEAILDASSSPPRQVFWRDMSHLGRGYSLQTLGAVLAAE